MQVFVVVFGNPYLFDEELQGHGWGGGTGFYKAETKESLFLSLKNKFLSLTCNVGVNGMFYGFINMDNICIGAGCYRRAIDFLQGKYDLRNPERLTLDNFDVKIHTLEEYAQMVAKESF